LPKPKGTMGATKMKIMAVICYKSESGLVCYGYNIWQALKSHFHTYLNDGDVRNVYHHLKDLCKLGLIRRMDVEDPGCSWICQYHLTEKGRGLQTRYDRYLKIVRLKSNE